MVSLNVCRSQMLCGQLAFFGLSVGLFFLPPYLTPAALQGEEKHREESQLLVLESPENLSVLIPKGLWEDPEE